MLNVASVNYVQANFQPKSSSDLRLKKNIVSIDESIDDFYFNLKPKKYRFKENDVKIHIGLIAQEVESNLVKNGLSKDYAVLDKRPVRSYTNEGLYIDDEVYRIEYEELITITIYEVQKLRKELDDCKSEINRLQDIIAITKKG